jgi:hypothetical protein
LEALQKGALAKSMGRANALSELMAISILLIAETQHPPTAQFRFNLFLDKPHGDFPVGIICSETARIDLQRFSVHSCARRWCTPSNRSAQRGSGIMLPGKSPLISMPARRPHIKRKPVRGTLVRDQDRAANGERLIPTVGFVKLKKMTRVMSTT